MLDVNSGVGFLAALCSQEIIVAGVSVHHHSTSINLSVDEFFITAMFFFINVIPYQIQFGAFCFLFLLLMCKTCPFCEPK